MRKVFKNIQPHNWRINTLFIITVTIIFSAVLEQNGYCTASMMDGQVIQDKIDAVAEKGGIITLKSGTYIINKPIILYPNITLKGAGMDKTLLWQADGIGECVLGAYGTAIPYRPSHDITIRDLTIDGNAEHNINPVKGCGIRLEGTYNYKIENVHVRNSAGFGGIYTNTFDYYKATPGNKKSYIENCIVETSRTGRDGLYGHGIYVTSMGNNNVVIKDNILRKNNGSGIFIEDNPRNIEIVDNKCYDNYQYGIWINIANECVVRRNSVYRNMK